MTNGSSLTQTPVMFISELSTPDLRPHCEALEELGEPQDEAGFLARVQFAESIARLTMQPIDKVPVERQRYDAAALFSGSGSEYLQRTRTWWIREDWAKEWEARVQENIPVECGLKFYLSRAMVAGRIQIGFRCGDWDTARIQGA